MGRKSDQDGYVYSTNPDFKSPFDALSQLSSNPDGQTLEVHIEKKQRAGKVATIVKGFEGSEEQLKDLAKVLKSACGVGGSAKDGEILIQGEKRDKVMQVLKEKGYQVKRVGG